jgi:hypothetical protein
VVDDLLQDLGGERLAPADVVRQRRAFSLAEPAERQ